MELLNYIRPEKRLSAMQNAFERLKPLIPKGNANHIAEKIEEAGKIESTLIDDSKEFGELYNSVKFSLLDYDPDAN